MINILCPSRGRPTLTKKMVDSFLENSVTNIEIQIYLNNDDPHLEEYRDLIDSKFIEVGPDRSPGYTWNLLSDKSKHSIDFLVADDLEMVTKGWDKRTLEYFDQIPDKLACVFPKHDNTDKNPHFMLHKNWKNVLGYFVPPHFHHWYVDTWTRNLSEKVDRYIRMEDVNVKSIASTNLHDDTTKKAAQSWTRTHDAYMWHRSQRWLELDAEVLKHHMN